ncbi:MAG: hypothetical protein WCV90_05570 [Candidatus Woesearchaeota archaeon]
MNQNPNHFAQLHDKIYSKARERGIRQYEQIMGKLSVQNLIDEDRELRPEGFQAVRRIYQSGLDSQLKPLIKAGYQRMIAPSGEDPKLFDFEYLVYEIYGLLKEYNEGKRKEELLEDYVLGAIYVVQEGIRQEILIANPKGSEDLFFEGVCLRY